MISQNFILSGADLVADLSGALFWPAAKLLIFSDLHLEKASSFATRGTHLPPYDTTETLRRMEKACMAYRPENVFCLGDSFHDRHGPERMTIADRARLGRMTEDRNWCWVTGNHDPELPDDLPGRRTAEERIGALVFRHEAAPVPAAGEISGHFHPSARVRTRQKHLSGRCFAYNGGRLILPAFGSFTGGLNVRDPAIRAILGNNFQILFLGPKRLYRFPNTSLA